MTDRQQEAIRAILEGDNVFLTAPGGYGKSWCIEQVTDEHTIIGAPTAVAAKNVAGETIHSLFGLPFGIVTDEDRDKISPKFRNLFNDDLIKRIVIDEVSLVRCDKLDLIDHKLRTVKKTGKPFGGLQVVLVGDLMQIPNIVEQEEKKQFRREYRSPHMFSSKVWKEANFKTIELTEPKRNENVDQIHLLQAIRTKDTRPVKGKALYEHAIDRVNEWALPDENPSQLHLCSYVADARRRNRIWYDKIDAPEVKYVGVRTGTYVGVRASVEQELFLKVGTQVIVCANNYEAGYINGDAGIITELNEDEIIVELFKGTTVSVERHKWEKMEYTRSMAGLEKKVTGTYTQFPIKLGYATSIHQSQGLTLDTVTIDVGRRGVFESGMLYVALSRVRDLRKVALTRPLRYDDVIIDKKVKRFYERGGE